jgi:xyloglucan-specific endo-beta-1,4-glucanase
MIWLGSLGGAGPISSTGSTIATPNIGGVSWNLYTGSHSQMTVFSFVAPSNIGSFSGDLTDFTDYLRANQGLSGDQIVQTIGAGTEPFIGENAVFTTESYSVSVA